MRRNFSILSLLLLVALAAVLIAWFMERNRTIETAAALEENQKRLEQYEGHLDITDPSKAHVVAVRELMQPCLRWKWRVHLPTDKTYRLHWTDFDIPADGILKEENNDQDRNYLDATEYSGDVLVELVVSVEYDGKWWMSLKANDQGLLTGDWPYWNEEEVEFPLDPEKFPLNFDDRHSVLPKHGTVVTDGDFFLLHAMYPQVPGKTQGVLPGCAEGFAVWFSELDKKIAAPPSQK